MDSPALQISKQSQTPENHPLQCQNVQKPHKISKSSKSYYSKWSSEEEILYMRFLKANIERMKRTQFKKAYNKFKKMSEFITSRDATQCRSHHQKMIKRHLDIPTIIQYLCIKNNQMLKRKPKEHVQKTEPNLTTTQINQKGSSQESDKLTTEKEPLEAKDQNEIINKNKMSINIPEYQQKYHQNQGKFEGYSCQAASGNKNQLDKVAQNAFTQIQKTNLVKQEDNFDYFFIGNDSEKCQKKESSEAVLCQGQILNRQISYEQTFESSRLLYNYPSNPYENIELRNQSHLHFPLPSHYPPFSSNYGLNYVPPYYGHPYSYYHPHPQHPHFSYQTPYHDYHKAFDFPSDIHPFMKETGSKIEVKKQD